jgi:hypothetical protein
MPSENGRNGNLKRTVPLGPNRIRNWFDQRWQAHGHELFFGGPKDGMLLMTGLRHMRSTHFPRDYALKMTQLWALDKDCVTGKDGFYGDFFPLAMSRQAMKRFATKVDHSFGTTADTSSMTRNRRHA